MSGPNGPSLLQSFASNISFDVGDIVYKPCCDKPWLVVATRTVPENEGDACGDVYLVQFTEESMLATTNLRRLCRPVMQFIFGPLSGKPLPAVVASGTMIWSRATGEPAVLIHRFPEIDWSGCVPGRKMPYDIEIGRVEDGKIKHSYDLAYLWDSRESGKRQRAADQ